MSIQTFFENLFASIKAIFAKVPKPLKQAIKIGVTVTENIKNVQDTGIPDLITKLIPGEVDDKIAAKIRQYLPIVMSQLKLADKCGELADPNEIVACSIDTLKQIGGDYQSAFLHNLSVLIAQVASDNKLSWSDGVYLIEWYYRNYTKKA